MVDEKITKKDLENMEENLGRMIGKGFKENTEQHQKIFKILGEHSEVLNEHSKILDNHTKRLERIEDKLEDVIYRTEFEKLKERMKIVEEALFVKRTMEQ